MSWAAAGWARRIKRLPSGKRISQGQKLLLLVLADYYNDEERMAWPTVQALADDALMSKRWALTCLAVFTAEGLIEAIEAGKSGRAWRRQGYRLPAFEAWMGRGATNEVVNSVHHLDMPGGGEGGELHEVKAVNSVHQPPAPPYKEEPVKEPTKEKTHHPAEGGNVAPQLPGARETPPAAGDDSLVLPAVGAPSPAVVEAVLGAEAAEQVLAVWREAVGAEPGRGDRLEARALVREFAHGAIVLGILRSAGLAVRRPRSLAYCRGAIAEVADSGLAGVALDAAIASVRRNLARGWTREKLGPGLRLLPAAERGPP